MQEHNAHLRAKEYLLAKSAFAREYIRYWHGVQPCPDETGYRLLGLFRKEVQTYVFNLKRGNDPGLKHAANEMYRLVAVGRASYTTDELNGFVKWYEKLKNRIGRAIGGLFDYHGDGFGDLCDSLPLTYDSVVMRCLATNSGKPNRDGYLSKEELYKDVKDMWTAEQAACGWHAFVVNGENYVESALEDAARKWFVLAVQGDEAYFPTAEEQEAVRYADHFDD